ncbi:MAG: BTAD domain-containing putative transcriptional regulator [Gemmatimonadaceae bacterium]
MIELSLLGPQAVSRSDGREFGTLPAQPKRFALLAFLTLAAGSYLRRDTIAAIFWPDLDQSAARRALRNTLYHLREALGDGVILTHGDEQVAIDPSMIRCDVSRLREAAEEGRYEDAVDLYRGELLAGMHFANSGEGFEEWLSAERARVLEVTVSAVRALADREEAAGNTVAAVYWAQRACTLLPGDETWLRRAMTLLDASGDRGGALRRHESYSKRLSAEFGAKPAAETESLAKRIKDGTATQQRATQSVEASASAVQRKPEPVVASIDPELSSAASHEPAAPNAPRRIHSRWRVIAASIVGVLLVAGVAFAVVSRRGKTPTPAARTRVVVALFDNRTGDPSLDVLGRMAEDWLTQGIMRTQLVDVVDPRVVQVQGRTADGGAVDPSVLGKRTGAGLVVSGSYYRSGDSLLFQAAVTNATSDKIVRVVGPIVSNVGRPVAALNELRSRVMTALASQVDMRVANDPDVGSQVPSFEAYQAYVEGRDAFWHGDGHRAEARYVDAMRLDPTFTAAAVGAASAAANYHHCTLVDSLGHWADTRGDGVTQVDRLSFQIAAARCAGRNDEMLRLTLQRADLEPRTSSTLLSAAAAALWAYSPSRALTILRRINPETDLGWSTDSTHFAYFSDLTEAYHLLGRHDEELAATTNMPSSTPLSRSWMRGRALAALGRPTATLALVDTIVTLPTETALAIGLGPYTDGRPQYAATPGWVTVWIARELMTHGDSATSRATAAKSYAWYRSRSTDERATSEERLVATWALELAHDYTTADGLAHALLLEDPTNVDYIGEVAGLAVERGEKQLADSLDGVLAARTDARTGWSANLYRARIAALSGHDSVAVARVKDALDLGAWPMWIHLEPAFARLHSRPDFAALTAPTG